MVSICYRHLRALLLLVFSSSLIPSSALFTPDVVQEEEPSATKECSADSNESNKEMTMTTTMNNCWNATSFQQFISSHLTAHGTDNDNVNDNVESVLSQQLLRGTIDNVLSTQEIAPLLELLPPDIFLDAAGYDSHDNNNNNKGYIAPEGYAAIGLHEMTSSSSSLIQKQLYDQVLQLRERVRQFTEQSLHMCPGTLYIDYTTISQKLIGGMHRPHADNCYHFYEKTTKKSYYWATCAKNNNNNHKRNVITDQHPHPHRVAASILYLNDEFDGGEFYFANRNSSSKEGYYDMDENVVDTLIPVQPGRMIYFTSGVENLHGALPVRRRRTTTTSHGSVTKQLPEKFVLRDEEGKEKEKDTSTRRLALAMWYVTDPELEEYVPPFRGITTDLHQSLAHEEMDNGLHPSTRTSATDLNKDPYAPEKLFSLHIPSFLGVSVLIEEMGMYLTSELRNIHHSLWTVNLYGEDRNTLHVLFKDHTAMFSLTCKITNKNMGAESGGSTDIVAGGSIRLTVERHTDGRKRPSLQYMLQESIMLHGVLDALLAINSGMKSQSNNETEMRKFIEDIELARETLPARRA